jgi:DNA-binding MarR family transcriptional regulator
MPAPSSQRRAIAQPLADFEANYPRNEAMARSYLSGQHTMAAIANHFGVHYATVSRAVKELEETGK